MIQKHRSMLINVTRFNDVQYELFDLVERYHNNFVNLLEEINSKISRNLVFVPYSELFELYLKDKTFQKQEESFLGRTYAEFYYMKLNKLLSE